MGLFAGALDAAALLYVMCIVCCLILIMSCVKEKSFGFGFFVFFRTMVCYHFLYVCFVSFRAEAPQGYGSFLFF